MVMKRILVKQHFLLFEFMEAMRKYYEVLMFCGGSKEKMSSILPSPVSIGGVDKGIINIIIQDVMEKVKSIIDYNIDTVDGVVLNGWVGEFIYPLIELANKNNILSVVIPNGIWIGGELKKESLMATCNAKYIFCGGEYTYNNFINLGYNTNMLVRTGVPWMDSIYKIKRYKPKVNNKLIVCGFNYDIVNTYKRGVVIDSILPHSNYFGIVEVAKKMKDYKFVFTSKQWGGNNICKYKDICDNVYIDTQCESWEYWLEKADLVLVSPHSTALLDSLYTRVPTVTAKLDRDYWDFLDANISICEWSTNSIIKAIESSIETYKDSNKFDDYYYTYCDGKATDRCLDAIHERI